MTSRPAIAIATVVPVNNVMMNNITETQVVTPAPITAGADAAMGVGSTLGLAVALWFGLFGVIIAL